MTTTVQKHWIGSQYHKTMILEGVQYILASDYAALEGKYEELKVDREAYAREKVREAVGKIVVEEHKLDGMPYKTVVGWNSCVEKLEEVKAKVLEEYK